MEPITVNTSPPAAAPGLATLPAPVRAFFDASTGRDGGIPLESFAPDAVVEDDGRSHAGRAAIDRWWRDAGARYRAVLEPLEAWVDGGSTLVSARATGDFPGSPVVLAFAFRLEGGRIARLEVRP